jgi:hypothetical protein
MTQNHLQDIEQLEAGLWAAADQLRANSKLTSSEYVLIYQIENQSYEESCSPDQLRQALTPKRRAQAKDEYMFDFLAPQGHAGRPARWKKIGGG